MVYNINILGCGWLGLPLGKFLAGKSHVVRGSTTREVKMEQIRAAGMDPWLLHHQNIDENVAFFDCDVLIVTLPPSAGHYTEMIDKVVQGAASSGSDVIFISSTSVYPDRNLPVTEDHGDRNATTRSGTSLLDIEGRFRNNPHFRTTVIRFAGLYGPGREPGRFLAGKQGLPGAGNPVNLIHLDDCIGIINAIIEGGMWGETFNACAPEHPSRQEFYTKACLNAGLQPPQFSSTPAPFKIINSGKLLKKLGYSFIHVDPMEDI